MTEDQEDTIDGDLSFTGTGQLLRHHTPDKCEGHYCCLHNPSDHHMVGWPLHFRADRPPLMERMCIHNAGTPDAYVIGHPDPDCVAYLQEKWPQGAWGVHGCDGCCSVVDLYPYAEWDNDARD